MLTAIVINFQLVASRLKLSKRSTMLELYVNDLADKHVLCIAYLYIGVRIIGMPFPIHKDIDVPSDSID